MYDLRNIYLFPRLKIFCKKPIIKVVFLFYWREILWKKYALYDKVRTFLFKIIYLFIRFVNWKLKICLFWLWFFLFFHCFSKKKYALCHKVRTFIRNQKRKGKSCPASNRKKRQIKANGYFVPRRNSKTEN